MTEPSNPLFCGITTVSQLNLDNFPFLPTEDCCVPQLSSTLHPVVMNKPLEL